MADSAEFLLDNPGRPAMNEDDTMRRYINIGAWAALLTAIVFAIMKFAGIKIVFLMKALCFTLLYILILVIGFFRDALDRSSQMVARLLVGPEDANGTATNVTNNPPPNPGTPGTPISTLTRYHIESTNGNGIPSAPTPGRRTPNGDDRQSSHSLPERKAGMDPHILQNFRRLERVFYSNATAADYLDPKSMDNALKMLEQGPEITLDDAQRIGFPDILGIICRRPDRLPEQDQYHYSSRAYELMKRYGFPQNYESLAPTPTPSDRSDYAGPSRRRSDSTSIPSFMQRNTSSLFSPQGAGTASQQSSRSTPSIRSPMFEAFDRTTEDLLQRVKLRFSYTNRDGKRRRTMLGQATIPEESEQGSVGDEELERELEQALEQEEGNRRQETPRTDRDDRLAAEQLHRELALAGAKGKGKGKAEAPKEHGVRSMLTRSAHKLGQGSLDPGMR